MPELPEVETTKEGIRPFLEGKKIDQCLVQRFDLRQPIPKDLQSRAENKIVERVSRRQKYILIHLSNAQVILIHLGMSGRMRVEAVGSALKKHDHVIFIVGKKQIVFQDPRRFGLVTLCPEDSLDQHALLKDLGPEPFSDEFSDDYFKAQLAKRKSPIKVALLDQKLISGVGNIYASEALFAAKISPSRPAYTLKMKEIKALRQQILSILAKAIESGGSSLRDYRQVDEKTGYFQFSFAVYGREKEPCLVCSTPIQRLLQTGRSTFFCPSCQSFDFNLEL